MSSKPILNTLSLDYERDCLLCRCPIKPGSKVAYATIGPIAWEKLLSYAEKWSNASMDSSNPRFSFTQVHECINGVNKENAFGKAHKKCRLRFFDDSLLGKYHTSNTNDLTALSVISADTSLVETLTDNSAIMTRSRNESPMKTNKKTCFICEKTRVSDNNLYDEGGLQRCGYTKSRDRLISQMEMLLQHPDHRFYPAAKRLHHMLSGSSTDVFSVDVYYHKSCYIKFAINAKPCIEEEQVTEDDRLYNHIKSSFSLQVRFKVIYQKQAFLLHHLLADFKSMCSEHYVPEHRYFQTTKSLRRYLQSTFEDELSFYPSGKYVIVHASSMNPCEYSLATLQGECLRDEDFIKSFSNHVKRKVKDFEFENPANSPEEMMSNISKGPIPILYNIIYASVYSAVSYNSHGYATTESINIATKIWSLACEWQSLILRSPSSVQSILGLTTHRLTGSKEVVQCLHRLGHTISYDKVLRLNTEWSTNQPATHLKFKNVSFLHATVDNNDILQDTIDGKNTTHDTNRTLFYPILHGEDSSLYQSSVEDLASSPKEIKVDIQPYSFSNQKEPVPIEGFEDMSSFSKVDKAFKVNVLWSLLDALPGSREISDEETSKVIGSWTPFQRLVNEKQVEKSIIEFQPMIPAGPSKSVCAAYMNNLLTVINDLGLNHIFVHADEDILSKLLQIKWNEADKFSKVIPFAGGFHFIRVVHAILYKRYSFLGLKEWFVESDVIAEGSIDNAMTGKGKTYYRCNRLHKSGFCAITQLIIEKITGNFSKMDSKLLSDLNRLKHNPSDKLVVEIIESLPFQSLMKKLTNQKGEMGKVLVSYLQDVSLLLCVIQAVRQSDINMHLEAERKVLPYLKAYNHPNYLRYIGYQHVFFSTLKTKDDPIYRSLQERGFGASYSGDPFSSVHGDLVTEYLNKDMKGTSGPFRSGHSTSEDQRLKWVSTAHIHAKLRTHLKNTLRVNTSSVHKEVKTSAKKRFIQDVVNLKDKLKSYEIDQSLEGPVKVLSTGTEIPAEISKSFFSAQNVGEQGMQKFISSFLASDDPTTVPRSIFKPITRSGIITGLEKKKKKKVNSDRSVEVEEDCQAFGELVGKQVNIEKALAYPLTKYPLSIAKTTGSMRSGSKSDLRNFLISPDQSDALSLEMDSRLVNYRALYDGFALWRLFKPRKTYKEWFTNIIEKITGEHPNATQIEIVNDHYLENSIKGLTRLSRGSISPRVHLKSVDQIMPQGKQWNSFFDNIENKRDLVKLALAFFRSLAGRALITKPLVFTCETQCYRISQNEVEPMPYLNHEEADTKIVYRACVEDTPTLVIAKDTDIFVLLIYARAHLKPTSQWILQIDRHQFVNIEKVYQYIGEDIAQILPQFHAITGCDSTSFKFRKGKVSTMKKILKNKTLCQYLKTLGLDADISDQCLQDALKFVQCTIYSGSSSETYLESRVRIYENLSRKSSVVMPPDEQSAIQDIRRCHLQVLIWIHCLFPHVPNYNPEHYGWRYDKDAQRFIPIWYDGPQSPPHHTSSIEPCTSDSASFSEPPKKKSCLEVPGQRIVPDVQVDHDEDDELEWQEDWDSTDSESNSEDSDEDYAP